MLKRLSYFVGALALGVFSCAKKGMPTGGPKDEVAPKMMLTQPANASVEFKGNQFKLFFDENITFKDLEKQLIVSPPLRNKLSVMPMTGMAKKMAIITINDTLQPNTTYSFNFGKSIVDATEANPLSDFKYLFSTGKYLDSLKLSGFVRDAELKKTEFPVSVFLYEADSIYNDSVVYNKNPRYVAITQDSLGTFSFENIKQGKYRMVAIKDKNENYRFDIAKEKIGFYTQPISVPNDTIYRVDVFKQIPDFKPNKPIQSFGNQLLLGYKGNPKNVKVSIKNGTEEIPSVITYFPKKDSLQVWYKPLKADSLAVKIEKDAFVKEFYVKVKEKKSDSLAISVINSGTLHFREHFALKLNTPLESLDVKKMKLFDADSTLISFKTNYIPLERKIEILFKKEPATKYVFIAEPGAIQDLFGTENDKMLSFKIETKELTEYGNLKVNIQNAKRFPVLVQLTNEKGEVLAEQSVLKNQSVLFEGLLPSLYQMRAVYDDNVNQIWDTGHYLKKIQPEEIVYFPKPLDVRMNWDIDQNFDLSK